MSKVIQALLSGIFFTFILDFFLFLGIKENYIDYYNIKVYYNILFADHQNIYIFFLLSAILGYITIYLNNKVALAVIGVLFFATASTLIPAVGKSVGQKILMKKNVTLHTDKFSYRGDIYYEGRREITFYDYDLKKVIILNKNEIKGKY